jgi:hypothetical protein
MAERDSVVRRIVCEYGRVYVYLYLTDDNGKIIEEEAFKQPFRLDLKDVNEETTDTFQILYQHLQDTVLYYATARDDDEDAESDDDDEED